MADKGITVSFDTTGVANEIRKAAERLDGPGARNLFRALAGTLEHEAATNFEEQGRPHWVPLDAATMAERLKRNKRNKKGSGVLKILQDSGMLASSIYSYYDEDSAVVGTNRVYAGIHQYGGTIDRPARSVKIRLRTDAKGRLERQGGGGRDVDARIAHGAMFAKWGEENGHKRYREQWATVNAYKIEIKARPYLPFSGPPGGEELQPEAEKSLLDTLQRHVLRAFD